MPTDIRPELSKRNKYYISRERYYELKHFCLQYDEWRQCYRLYSDSTFTSKPNHTPSGTRARDTVYDAAERRLYFRNLMEVVEQSAYETSGDLAGYILEAVTHAYTYDTMLARTGVIFCCKDVWYELYRKFFWILDRRRR